MNKLCVNLFTWLFPLYPIWAWITFTFTSKPIEFPVSLVLLPLALYFVFIETKKLPGYLLCFLLFTCYHLVSAALNGLIPKETSLLYYLLSDVNVTACLFFIVVEHTTFDEAFIRRMTRNILLIVIVSVIVSLIQTQNSSFFFNSAVDYNLSYTEEKRLASIYSWTALNSVGVTFPILISILVCIYERDTWILAFSIIGGIIVSFLTKGRYIMVSTIIAFAQLFFSSNYSLAKRLSYIVAFVSTVFLAGFVAQKTQIIDINQVIEQRILEKESDFASAKARVLSYDVFLKVFPENPFLGVGPETRKDVVEMLQGEAPLIHVGYLSYLYFYGIVGFGFLLFALFFLLRDAWVTGRNYGFWGSFYGLLGFAFANFTMVYFNFSEMGIVLAVIYIKYYNSLEAEEPEEEAELADNPEIANTLPVAYD